MDPRKLAMMQQMMQQQGGGAGAPGGQPQPDAGQGDPGIQGFDHNPFEGLQFSAGQGDPSASAPSQAQPAGPDGQPTNQLLPGQNPDSSKPLTSAVQAIQKYIETSTDENEIATARSIIALISRLMEKDQQNHASNLPTDKATLTSAARAIATGGGPGGPQGPATPPTGGPTQ